eukprot:EG_transcript_16301
MAAASADGSASCPAAVHFHSQPSCCSSQTPTESPAQTPRLGNCDTLSRLSHTDSQSPALLSPSLQRRRSPAHPFTAGPSAAASAALLSRLRLSQEAPESGVWATRTLFDPRAVRTPPHRPIIAGLPQSPGTGRGAARLLPDPAPAEPRRPAGFTARLFSKVRQRVDQVPKEEDPSNADVPHHDNAAIPIAKGPLLTAVTPVPVEGGVLLQTPDRGAGCFVRTSGSAESPELIIWC